MPAVADLHRLERALTDCFGVAGPDAFTLHDIATLLSQHAGRTVTCQSETVREAYASRAPYGAPSWQLDAWVSTYLAIADGSLEPVSGDVERITGTPPLGLADLLRA